MYLKSFDSEFVCLVDSISLNLFKGSRQNKKTVKLGNFSQPPMILKGCIESKQHSICVDPSMNSNALNFVNIFLCKVTFLK